MSKYCFYPDKNKLYILRQYEIFALLPRLEKNTSSYPSCYNSCYSPKLSSKVNIAIMLRCFIHQTVYSEKKKIIVFGSSG